MLTHELVGKAMAQAMATERMSSAGLAELQERKLRGLLRHAVDHSPFYARLYAGLDVERIALAYLPTVNKRLLQDNFDEVVTDRRLTRDGVRAFCAQPPSGPPWHLGEFAVLMSSGTSGERGHFVIDGPALADAIAAGFRQSNRGVDPRKPPEQQRIAAVMLIEPFDAAGMLMRLIPESVGPKLLVDIRQDFARVCRQLNEFQPTLLSSFPYMLRMLSEAADDGRLSIRPGRITSSGDVLTASDRACVRRSLGCEPYDYYCSTEVPYIAWEGDDHDGLYVNADYCVVESVDAAHRPVAPGRLGDKLLLTNLSNRAMPLIRYEMSDQVEYLPAGGGLAGPLPRIRTVAGRVEHTLQLPGAAGRVPLVPEHIDEYVGGLEGLVNYQVIQEEAARLTVNYIVRPPADAITVGQTIRIGLLRCFDRYGVTPDVRIDLHAVEQLEPVRPGSTKVCHYWNRSSS
jgi:phenylacetate-CoA ligase